jgi:hypothetical protein
MANTEQENTEKNLISRRTLLNNGLLTGITVAAGFYLKNPSGFSLSKEKGSDAKNGANNNLAQSGKKSYKDTYIDNFDC